MNNVRDVYTHQTLSNRCVNNWSLPVGLENEAGVPKFSWSTVDVPGAAEKPSSVIAERHSHGRNITRRYYLFGLLHMGLELGSPLELGKRGQ